jgi:hypothetical protein
MFSQNARGLKPLVPEAKSDCGELAIVTDLQAKAYIGRIYCCRRG